ncbi:MAG: pyrimidine dimer DNA glycosylase/endonuclease V [archaeon]|nr:pyrimidine dimer DNA glycosylase/endonuclease V [archaeon]
MVRLNLFSPEKLSDQHLIAEYNEILMLVSYIKNYPAQDNLPENYCLGKGHMRFFCNKTRYVKKRHELLKAEMKKRGFIAVKNIVLSDFSAKTINDWIPSEKDFDLIRKRITEKLKLKPNFYRYYGKSKPTAFFIGLLKG